jgi:hypothetical protein
MMSALSPGASGQRYKKKGNPASLRLVILHFPCAWHGPQPSSPLTPRPHWHVRLTRRLLSVAHESRTRNEKLDGFEFFTKEFHDFCASLSSSAPVWNPRPSIHGRVRMPENHSRVRPCEAQLFCCLTLSTATTTKHVQLDPLSAFTSPNCRLR